MSLMWVRVSLLVSAVLWLLPYAGYSKYQFTRTSSVDVRREMPTDSLTVEQTQALEVLNQLANKAKEIQDQAASIRIRVRIADSLWDYDGQRARTLFKSAYEAINSVREEQQTVARLLTQPGLRSQLRNEVLRIVASRDHQLMKDLLQEPTDNRLPEEAGNLSTVPAMNPALARSLASALVDTDVQTAIDLTRRTLAAGIDSSLVVTLSAISRQDPQGANQLFLQALGIARVDSKYDLSVVDILGPYVFSDYGYGPPLIGNDRRGGAIEGASTSVVVMPFLQLAVLKFLEYARSTPASSPIPLADVPFHTDMLNFATLRNVLPFLRRYLPEDADRVSRRMDEILRDATDIERGVIAATDGQESVDDLLNRANKSKGRLKDSILIKASNKLSRQGHYEDALSVLDGVENEGRRDAWAAYINAGATIAAIEEGDTERAYLFATKMKLVTQRAVLLSRVASVFAKKKDVVRAKQLLQEGARSMLRADDTLAKSAALLTISSTMARLDTIEAYELLRSAIASVNRIKSFTRPPASIDRYGRSNDEEVLDWLDAHLGLGALDFDTAFASLAKIDFIQALLIGQSLGRKDFSLMAQVAVCRSVLAQRRPGEARAR